MSILKKPRQPHDVHPGSRAHQPQHNQCQHNQRRGSSNDNSGQDVAHEDGACDDKEDWDQECEEDDDEDDDDEDDESECEIIFERNVSFNDPLATDIVTGDPVKPSPLSRLEWTALKARECLEREREEFGREREAFDEAWLEFEDTMSGSRRPEGELDELEDAEGVGAGEENKEDWEEESMSKNRRRHEHIDTPTHECKDAIREGSDAERKTSDTDVENPVLEITETVVRLVGQEQKQQQ